MILYQDDWLRYPGAIPDYKTKNKSFLAFAKTLQAFGVKNCLFPLSLLDQSLAGLDPHDQASLTPEQKIRINIEIAFNPWYFLREVARIPVDGVPEGIRVNANRGIIAQWWCIFNNFDIFMVQPRQTGKSVGMDLNHVYMTLFRKDGGRMLVLTKDRGLIAKNVQKLKQIRALLPSYTWLPSKKDKDVESIFNYASKDNVLNFLSAQTDEFAARNASRGHTVTRFHCDEGPFTKYVDVMIPSISASMDAAISDAKKLGEEYGRIYTTTPGDLTTRSGKYMYNMYINSYPFDEQLFDAKDYKTLEKQFIETTGIPIPRVSITYNHRQLGIADEEFYRRIKSVDSTDEDINKDYFLIWGKGGASSLIEASILDAMDKSIKAPDHVVITETGYVERWFIPEAEKASYLSKNKTVLGVDTSDQIGRDKTAFVLINPYTLDVAMTLSVHNASVINAAKWLANFMVASENTILIIEKKSSAMTFIDVTIEALWARNINPFTRIWNRIIDENTIKPELHGKLKRGIMPKYDAIEECRKFFGFNTSSKLRTFLYSKILRDATSSSRHVMKDQELVNQLAMLKTDENGRVDHESGEHDDKCIAWLLTHWLIRYARHLDYYGIDSSKVMFGIGEDGRLLSDEDIQLAEAIELCQQEADEMVKRISETHHVGLRMRYQHELELMNEFLTKHGVQPKVIDAMMKADKAYRRHALQQQRYQK